MIGASKALGNTGADIEAHTFTPSVAGLEDRHKPCNGGACVAMMVGPNGEPMLGDSKIINPHIRLEQAIPVSARFFPDLHTHLNKPENEIPSLAVFDDNRRAGTHIAVNIVTEGDNTGGMDVYQVDLNAPAAGSTGLELSFTADEVRVFRESNAFIDELEALQQERYSPQKQNTT